MPKTHGFTAEKLNTWDTAKLRILRENAEAKGVLDLIEMCDSELATRQPKRKALSEQFEHSANAVVSEYHFVCAKDRGVLAAGPGRFWSGAWVVAESNVKKSIEYGAYLALHETKADPSYRQGKVIDYRRGARDMVDKDNEGIEFLVEETVKSLEWQGGGSGEKGYTWEELIRRSSPDE